MRSVTREPLPHPLGSRSEAYLGSLHKPHQNGECLQTSDPHCNLSFRGSTCSLGEKFSECFADKIDQIQTRLPAAKLSMLHVEASRAAVSQRSHRPGAVRTSGGPTGSLSDSKACPVPLSPKPIRDKSPKCTNWVIKNECPPNVLLRKFAHRHKQKGGQRSGMAQAKRTAVFWMLAHSLSTLFTNMLSSSLRGPGHSVSWNMVLGDKAQASGTAHSPAIPLVKVSNLGETSLVYG